MIYDGNDLGTLLKVEKIHRPWMAEVRNETVDSRGSDGMVHEEAYLEPKYIDVDVRLIAPTWGASNQKSALEKLRRKLSGLLFRRHPCKLVLHDADDLYEMAVLDGSVDFEEFCFTASSTLTWVCPDPVSYGAFRTHSSEGGLVKCLVDGNYPTNPLITVDAEGPFQVLIDDATFDVTESIVGEVSIDARNPMVFPTGHSVSHDGYTVAYSIFSDFPEFSPGIHEVGCTRPFTVSWEERWL